MLSGVDDDTTQALVLARREVLREQLRRDQATIRTSMWWTSTGVTAAIVFGVLGGVAAVGCVPGMIAFVLGIRNITRAFGRIGRAQDELEALRPKPLPVARVVR